MERLMTPGTRPHLQWNTQTSSSTEQGKKTCYIKNCCTFTTLSASRASRSGFKSCPTLRLTAITSYCIHTPLVIVAHLRMFSTLVYICETTHTHTDLIMWVHIKYWFHIIFLKPWQVLDSGLMMNPEGHLQLKPPMVLMQRWEQGESAAHSSSSNEHHNIRRTIQLHTI